MKNYKVVPGERIIEADTWDVDAIGSLAFHDEAGEVLMVYAPGAWRTFEPVGQTDG